MMKRAREVYWIVNYLQDIRADFFAIYHIHDWDDLDGPLFISLVERLPMYEGALQGRIRLENEAEENQNTLGRAIADSSAGYEQQNDTGWAPGQTLTLAEALSGDAQLRAMQEESVKQGWGDLFEIKTG